MFALSILIRWPSFGTDPAKTQGYSQFQRFNNNEVWLHDEYVLNIYNTYPVNSTKLAAYIGGDPQFLPNKNAPALTVYTSFPPAHFIVLYYSLKLLRLGLTYFNMQLFSLVIHLLCVALTYYLCYVLTRDKLLAVLGASIYIFSTGTLQYHMNVYWAHELLMPVFLTALIVFTRGKGIFKWWQGLGLGLAMSLITWTGSVGVLGFALYGGYKFFTTKNRAYLSYLFMVAGMLIGLGIILLQVILATGTTIPQYLSKVLHRAQARSIGSDDTPLAIMAWRFMNDLFLDYGGYIIIAYTLAVKRKIEHFGLAVLFVAAFPLLESIPLLEHDEVYGFGRLKWLAPIVIAVCLLGQKFATTKRRRVYLTVAVICANIVHAALYFVVYQAI